MGGLDKNSPEFWVRWNGVVNFLFDHCQNYRPLGTMFAINDILQNHYLT